MVPGQVHQAWMAKFTRFSLGLCILFLAHPFRAYPYECQSFNEPEVASYIPLPEPTDPPKVLVGVRIRFGKKPDGDVEKVTIRIGVDKKLPISKIGDKSNVYLMPNLMFGIDEQGHLNRVHLTTSGGLQLNQMQLKAINLFAGFDNEGNPVIFRSENELRLADPAKLFRALARQTRPVLTEAAALEEAQNKKTESSNSRTIELAVPETSECSSGPCHVKPLFSTGGDLTQDLSQTVQLQIVSSSPYIGGDIWFKSKLRPLLNSLSRKADKIRSEDISAPPPPKARSPFYQ